MNKVDLAVKKKMLQYPSLYPNRFMALADIFEHFHWNADGELVEPDRRACNTPATSENYLSYFEEEHRKSLKRLEEEDGCLSSLHGAWELAARLQLENARAQLANIDLIASSRVYYGAGGLRLEYQTIGRWLASARQHSLEYFSIVPKNGLDVMSIMTEGRIPPPIEEMDGDWRCAIESWLGSLTPVLNNDWGVCDDWVREEERRKDYDWYCGWACRSPEMQDVWNIIISSLKYYRSSSEYARQCKFADEVISKIINEKADT